MSVRPIPSYKFSKEWRTIRPLLGATADVILAFFSLHLSKMSDILTVMVTISLRAFQRNPRYQRLAHGGVDVLVTKRGRPYLRILPPPKAGGNFLGAARAGKPLKVDFLKPAIARHEWEAAR